MPWLPGLFSDLYFYHRLSVSVSRLSHQHTQDVTGSPQLWGLKVNATPPPINASVFNPWFSIGSSVWGGYGAFKKWSIGL